MAKEFDPYYEWLGIPPKDQPPNHYRLLGIELFETNRNVIDAAANRQMGFIKEYQAGEHSELTQGLLNELAAARICLLNEEKKAAYDEGLRAKLKAPPRPLPLGHGDALDGPTEDATETEHEPVVLLRVPMTAPIALEPILPPAVEDAGPLLPATPDSGGSGTPVMAKLLARLSEPRAKGIMFGLAIGLACVGLAILLTLWAASLIAPKRPSERDSHEVAELNTAPSAESVANLPGRDERTEAPKIDEGPQNTKPPPITKPATEPARPESVTPPPPAPAPPPVARDLEQAEQRLNAQAAQVSTAAAQQAVAREALTLADRAILDSQVESAKRLAVLALKLARMSNSADLLNDATGLMIELDQPISDALKDKARQRLARPRAPATASERPPLAIAPFDETTARQHQAAWAKYLKAPVVQTNFIRMKLVLIPPGEFLMGSPEGDSDAQADEKPQHKVRISKPFYLGVTEVTQEQYERVMGENPSKFKGDPQRPVETVTWEDAVAFCRKLSEKEGRTYRLPREAEWEYACRAGSKTRWSFGDDESALTEYAWYTGNSKPTTHPVGEKKLNAWGLCDMHGNAWEWCADWYAGDYYTASPTDDPRGSESGSFRVFRGGCWAYVAVSCRAAYRDGDEPSVRCNGFLGFRLARAVSLASAAR